MSDISVLSSGDKSTPPVSIVSPSFLSNRAIVCWLLSMTHEDFSIAGPFEQR